MAKYDLCEVEEERPDSPSEEIKSRVHPVEGYPDDANMWVKIGNIEKEEKPVCRHPNGRSAVQIQISDKVFRLRKNPFYANNSALAERLRPFKQGAEDAEDDASQEQEGTGSGSEH